MPMDWEAAYKAAGVKKTSSGESSSGGTDWAKAYRAAGVEMQKPELEDLGEMPSVSRSGWRGMYTANGGTMRGAALQRGAAELETQGKELSALELYIQRAQENARKAGDYLRYSGTEESENSYRDALEAYQRAVDAYNEGAKEYNSGLTAFRNTEEVKLPGRAEGKSYGELQKMIEDTADELDRTQDENQRGRLNRELQYYRAVQSQTTPTAKEAAEEARRAERDYEAEAGAVRQLYAVLPDGTTVPIWPGVTQQEAVENEKRSARAAELERVANAYRAIEYDMAHEEGVAEMPQGMRDVILEAGRASLTVQDAGTAARRGDGVTGSEELGEEIAGAQETIDEARRALRALGYDEETVDSYMEWGAMKAGQERAQRVAGMYKETAEDNNALQNILSGVGWGITSGAGYLDLLRQEVATAGSVDALTGKKKPVDFYSDRMLPTVIRNAITEGEKTKVEKKMMEKYSDKEVAQKKAEKRMNAYQIAESMGESAITMALSVMGVPATTLILASSAATQTALSMHEQGYGEGQAMTMAGIAGLAEYITEKVSLENFEQIFGQRSVRNLTGWKQKLPVMLRNVLSQAVTEGSEEVASDIINGMADMLVLRDDGQFYRRVRAYQAQGMTQEEAAARVMSEEVKELVDSFKAGAISGGLFGVGGTAINAALAKYQDTGTGRAITRAGNAQQVTELVQALDQEAQTRLGLGEYTESSAEQVGRAARILTEEKMADAIRGRLMELGETANDDLVAAIMDSAEPGMELNWKERQALSSSTAGQQVVNELNAVGGLGNKSAAQLAVDGLRNGTLTRDNAWVIQAVAEQEQAERDMTEAKEKTAPAEEPGKRNYSRRANEIFSNAEKLGEFERIFGPLEGSNTEKRAKIAETLRKIDSETFRFEGAEEVTQEAETAAEETAAEETAAEEETLYKAYESYVRGLMMDMTPSAANEIRRTPELRAAWESITGEKLNGNGRQMTEQIMNSSAEPGEVPARISERRIDRLLEGNTEEQKNALKEILNGAQNVSIGEGRSRVSVTVEQENQGEGYLAGVYRADGQMKMFRADSREGVVAEISDYLKGGQEESTGQKNTPSETGDETVKVRNKSERKADSGEILRKLRESMPELESEDPVATVEGTEFEKGEIDLVTQVEMFFRRLGNKVFRKGFGNVTLNRQGVKSDIAHGIGRAKAATFAAVPSVIEKGKQIDFQPDWKGRGKDSFVFAAKINMGGKPSYVACVVLRGEGSEFYLHEVLDENGNILYTKKEAVAEGGESAKTTGLQSFKTRPEANTGAAKAMASDESIAQTESGVKSGEQRTTATSGTATVVEGGVRLGNGEIVQPPAGMSAEEFAGKLNALAERRQAQRTAPEEQKEVTAPEEQKEVTLTEALEKIGVTNITGSLADYGSVRSEQNMARVARDAKKYLRRVLKETNADEKTRVFARDMARGLYTEQDIPASMSRDKVKAIADAYRYVDGVTTDSLSYRRRQINFKLDEDARKLFKDSEQYDPGKFGQISKILMNERTPDRVLRSIFGEKKGAELYEYYWRPIIENNAAAKLWKNRQREDVREFRDSKGQLRELNQDEKAYAMKVLEGLAFEEEYRKAAGMDRENMDRYITNFRNLMEMMPEPGYNAEAERVDRVLDGTLNRAEAEKQSGNVGLFRRIYENRMATASLPQLDEATQKTLDGYEAAMQNRSEIEADETVDAAIIEAAAKAYQQKYADMYTAINQVLVAHGYEEIGFIKGYAPHMQPEAATNGLGKIMQAMGMQSSVSNLPASIAGMTANFKPNMRYNPHFQTRTGKETEYDIAKGFQEYTDYMGDIIYHMDDIMRLRRAVNYFRTEYAGEGIRERIEQAKAMLTAKTEDKAKFAEEHDLGYVPGMSDGQIAELIERYIEDNYGETGKLTKYSEFTTWLENAANILAGKQSLADRGMEYTGGRRVLNIGNNVLRVFRNSKVAGNLSSVLNQTAQLPAITTHFLKDGGGKYMAQALTDMASGDLEAEGWKERSAFLVGKMDEVKISEKGYEKFMNYLFTPAGMMDNAISTMAVRAEYLRQLDKGKSEKEAMRLADDYGRQVMGSRVKLEKPQAYESKRILSQMVHMFQVEAANSFDYIVSDLPLEIRSMAQTQGVKKAAGATAAAIVMYLLQAFLINRVAEETYGGSPVPFDLLGMTAQFFASGNGLRAGDYMLQVIDNGLEDMGGERIFGTENTIGTGDFELGAAVQDILYTMGGDVPLVRNALATLGVGDQTLPIPSAEKIWTGAKGVYKGLAGTDETLGGGDADWRKVAESAANIVGEVAPVGSQLKKTAQGISTMQYGGAYDGVGDNAQLKYAVNPTAGNWLKAVLFGRNALGQNEAYYAAEERNLTAAQTDVWEMLVEDMGMEREAAYKAIQRYRAVDRDKSLTTAEKKREKLAMIDGLEIPESGKVEVWADLMKDGDHTGDEYWAVDTMMKMGATFGDIAAAKSKHDEIAENEGKKSTMATEFAAWVDQYAKRRGLSEALAEKMKSTWKFWAMTPTEATTYEKLVDSNLSSSKATHIYTLWSLLQPTGGKSTVSDVQKLYTLAAEDKLTDEERYAAAGTLTDMEEYNESGELSAYGKMLQVQRQGMSFKDYADLRRDGAMDYYIKYRSTVDDNEVAKKIALEVKSLGTDDVKDWQRVQAICKATGDEDYQVAAMEAIMDEAEYFKFIQANGYGVTPEMWAKLKRALPKFDADYSGTYKQAEVKSAIDSLKGLDDMERAALWQMATMGKKNPYNREVGTEMYVSYNRWSGERKAAERARRKQEMEG